MRGNAHEYKRTNLSFFYFFGLQQQIEQSTSMCLETGHPCSPPDRSPDSIPTSCLPLSHRNRIHRSRTNKLPQHLHYNPTASSDDLCGGGWRLSGMQSWCIGRLLYLPGYLLRHLFLSNWDPVLSCLEAAKMPQLWCHVWLRRQTEAAFFILHFLISSQCTILLCKLNSIFVSGCMISLYRWGQQLGAIETHGSITLPDTSAFRDSTNIPSLG